ncbi:MAG: ABC transporter permease [Bacteroidia bacterium]|nr:ABC transporter permease [Bacteroidia bacterium]
MNWSYFIASRLSFGKNKSFTRLIIRLAQAGVALSVATMIIAVATVTGYQKEIARKVTGFGGHIIINNTGTSGSFDYTLFRDSAALVKKLLANKQIKSIDGVLSRPAITKANDELEGIILKGVGKNANLDFFKESLIKGKMPAFPDSVSAREVLISEYLSNRLNIKTGDKIRLYFILEPVRVLPVKVSGIYKTGFEENDKLYVIGDIRDMQRIFGNRQPVITHYEVEVNDIKELKPVTAKLQDELDENLTARDMMSLNPQIFQWLNYLNDNINIILGLMVIVACINMITALLILIIERTNMIGVLKALGAPDLPVKKVFIYHILWIMGAGLLFGNLLGIGICLSQYYGEWFTLPQETYYLSVVPVNLEWSYILAINAGTMFICLMSLLLPATLVSRITPVKAIRFD